VADSLVLYDVDDKVSIISLNRPDKLNAISNELLQRLTEAFDRADADPAASVVLLCAEDRSSAPATTSGRRVLAPTIGGVTRRRRMRISNRSSNLK
jgi:1,4-dihydroxy-2-naphthoyl-CoA synthase